MSEEDYTIILPKIIAKMEVGGFTYQTTWIPNRFHRFMQRLCFGFKWSRIKTVGEK